MMAMKGMMKGGGKGSKGGGLSDFGPEKKVWVGNLPATVSFKDLMEHFKQAGKVKWAESWKNQTGGVAFATAEEAASAITTLNGSMLSGSVLQVDVWTQKEKKEGETGKGGVKRKWHDNSGWDPYKMMKGMWGMKGGGKGWGSEVKPIDESGGVIGEFMGTIKSFAEGTGYGFIECPEIKAQFACDVFLHYTQRRNYKVGNKIKFTAVLNKDGKPNAKDLKSGLKGTTPTAVEN